jgi:hypothetical protein
MKHHTSYSQTYVGKDGYHLYFRYVDFNISVDSPLTNYNDTVTMTVSCYGYVSVSTNVPVTFECSGGYPSAGRIQVNEINGTSATVEFISCSQYVVTFEGVAEIHDWH